LNSFHRTNPNLLQRLMVEGTSVASFHARDYILCLLTYELINNGQKKAGAIAPAVWTKKEPTTG
jgi:hypothetical protein